ncbi:MAG: cyclase family protein [Rhodococcus sp.]|nr:cyclase family protein [Rhodococcus sp. (in: high G+C Gram-positive bacteria)]
MTTERLDIEWVRSEGERLRRWGRWGAEDGKGALNLLSEQRVLDAVSTVRLGKVISLAMPFGSEGPMPDQGRYNPKLTMVEVGNQDLPGGFQYADDTLFMSMQGATQWDALSHAFYDGVMWNGHTVSESLDERGTSANSVTSFRDGVVGRGVLIDVARHLGVDCLDDNYAVGPELLDDVLAAQATEIHDGDIALVRTGRVGRAVREGAFPFETFIMASPGLSVRCADWLVRNDVAAVAADNVAVEVTTSEAEGAMMPLHMICQRDAGIVFGELFDLEVLAEVCSEERRWTFLLVAPPLPVTGAVGGPVNPIAIL